MSQDRILAALSSDPLTQRELSKMLKIESGVVSHRLNSLIKKGLIERKILEIRYRPFGYVRTPSIEVKQVTKWTSFFVLSQNADGNAYEHDNYDL